MTPEQQHRTEMLRTAMNAIFQNIKAQQPLSFIEVKVTESLCQEVEEFTDSDENPWRTAALITKRLLKGDDVRRDWLDIYAGLPPMETPK